MRRNVAAQPSPVETWQVYGIDGELLSEYAASAGAASPQKEYGYRNGQLLITADAPAATRTNVALATNGAVASASSTYGPGYAAGAVINGSRSGSTAGNNGNWNDASPPAFVFPDWVEVDFSGSKTIDELDVFNLQDNWSNPIEPTAAMTFSLYGLTGYEVQYWNPDTSGWATVTGGNLTNNNKVWNKFTFAALTTTKIRVLTHSSPDGWCRLTEVEAWTTSSASVQWLVADQLGTPRMIFEKTGSLAATKRHDYLPFGEELTANQGLRTTTMGYSTDGVRQKFTLKERDTETGLDYFGARYYSSLQGRFTAPDEFTGGPDQVGVLGSGDSEKQALPYADITNPGSLNKYHYSFNNPLSYTDPDGHAPQDPAPEKPSVIQQIVDKGNAIVGAMLRNFERERDPVREDEPRRGPLSMGDKQIQIYADAKGQAAENAREVLSYADITGVATAYHGVQTGNRTETVLGILGMALHVAPVLKPVSGALEKLGLEVLTNNGGVLTARGTAGDAGKLFNLLRGGNKVEVLAPGKVIAKSAYGKGYVTFRTAANSESGLISVDFHHIQSGLKKIHLIK